MSGDLAVALLLFAGSAALVIFSGVFLAKYGDALAELMGWGRLWAGTILVALATSLPELLTNITASVRDLPELAGGNILGSNMVNMLILALVALLFGGAGFFRRIAPEHKPLALTAMSLTGIALILGAFHVRLSFAGVGLASLLMIGAYLGGMRAVYVARPHPPGGSHEAPSPGLPNLRRAWIYFGLASFGVLLAAPTLAISVEQIAESTGLASSFLGVVAVAVVTSMPEISTSIAAVRMGAVDLAIGNLYGSCALNIVLLSLADPFYRKGVLVETLGDPHFAAGVVAIALMGLGLSQILLRGGSRYLPVVPTIVVMGLVYFGGVYAVYELGKS